MSIFDTKSFCMFYKAASGVALGGGCSKEYLESVSGVTSTIMGAGGAPKFSGDPTTIVNSLGTNTKKVSITHANIAGNVVPGLGVVYDQINLLTHEEVTSVVGTEAIMDDCSNWSKDSFFYVDSVSTHTTLEVTDGSLFTVGDQMLIEIDGEYLSYEVLTIVNDYVTIEDSGYVYSVYYYGTCAPEYPPHPETFTIGGACNDLQEALDGMTAEEYDAWLFIGDDVALTTWLEISSTGDGSSTNNTRLYMCGYVTTAFDSLPIGYGYWDESTVSEVLRDSVYKTALERAIIGNDPIDHTMRKITCPTGDYARTISLRGYEENIWLAGINFVTANNLVRLVYLDSTLYGSVHIAHCNQIRTSVSTWAYAMITADECGSGGSIFDCYGYNTSALNKESGYDDESAHFDIGYNCFEKSGNVNDDYYSVTYHHNIMKGGNWGVSAVSYGHMVAYNNVFYLDNSDSVNTFAAFLNMNATKGSAMFYNNICCFDTSKPVITNDEYGIIRIGAGGEVRYWDYNLIFNLEDGEDWPSDKYITWIASGNADWKGEFQKTLGLHAILDQDPLFVDPSNWDFRLKPGSPCIGVGRPDPDGTVTNIGIDQRQIIGAEVQHV